MKKLLIVFVAFFAAHSFAFAQNIPAYTANDVLAHIKGNDTVYIVNFWATWCPPCVAELPEFNKLQERYEGKPVKILLVSLDFKKDYPEGLKTFVRRMGLTPQVAWFNETNPDDFIPKIETSWLGSIPCTLIVENGEHPFRKFIEATINEKEIAEIVDNRFTIKR